MMINDRMLEYCVERVSKIVNKQRKALSCSKIFVSGIAHKKAVYDYRGSPELEAIK